MVHIIYSESYFYLFLADLDYSSLQLNFMLTHTQHRQLFNISIIDDSILEIIGNETFSVLLTTPMDVQLATSEMNVTIKDNDRKSVLFPVYSSDLLCLFQNHSWDLKGTFLRY